MPEQPQWSERTLDMPPQDPWAEPPTVTAPAVPHAGEPTRAQPPTRVQPPHTPTSPAPQTAPQSPFSQGRAQVTPRVQHHDHTSEHEPTGTGWPDAEAPRQQHSLGWHIRQLRRGGEWSTAAVLFTFVCWGIWTLSGDGGSLTTPIVVFVVTLLVAAGVFALARLVGRLVLERQMGRQRHTARGSHLVASLFLAGAGFTFLQQTQWVVDVFNWVKNLF